jgi:response regulator RpfG family c-di-GMP phosphodiesterase
MDKDRVLMYVDDDPDVRSVLGMRIECEFQAEVIEAVDVKSAKTFLEERTKIDVVVCDFYLPDENGHSLYVYCRQKYPNTPFIFMSRLEVKGNQMLENFLQEHPANAFVPKPIDKEVLSSSLKRAFLYGEVANLESIHRSENLASDHGYVGIKIGRILHFKMDINFFIKLAESKFVKIHSAGDAFAADLFEKYSAKGIEMIYVAKSDYDHLISKLTQSLIDKVDLQLNASQKGIEPTPLEVAHTAHHVFDHVINSIKDLGLDAGLVLLAQKAFLAANKAIESDKKLLMVLKGIMQGKGLLTEHSLATGFFAVMAAKQLGLVDEKTLEKLYIAAFLHDVALKDDDDCRSELAASLEHANLAPEAELRIRNHTLEAEKLAWKLGAAYSDVALIVRQHHELPDRQGYPYKMNSISIHPLSALFSIAHQLALVCFLQNFSLATIQNELKKMEKTFSDGHYAKYFKVFQVIFLKI